MDNFDVKQLKELAEACRKAGIQTFKGFGIEFTLDPNAPGPKPRGRAAQKNAQSVQSSNVPSNDTWDSLTDDQKLFYSALPHVADTEGN